MKKQNKIRKRADFVKVSRFDCSFRIRSIVVICGPNGLDNWRVGFTATKKVGNAVVRNHCKRRMRAVADQLIPKMGKDGIDYVFIAKAMTFGCEWKMLIKDTTAALLFLNRKVF
ncbi:MAG: ribonuclease P protein component [Holosporaceae bacterium]|nr:ribonuclease P protein component [Holosporaceae bacterium]